MATRTRPSRRAWCASVDKETQDIEDVNIDPAIQSGQQLRDELNRMSSERQSLAEQTQQKLKDMNEKLSDLMAQLRAEAGMPPVADLPEGFDGTDEQSSSSSSSSSTSSGTATPSSGVTSNGSDDAGSSSDEPYMDPKNFGYESTPGWQVLAESLQLPESEATVEFRVQCDTSGCSIVEVKGDEPVSSGVRSQFIHSGAGYRVGFDPDASKACCALVGTDSWTIALNFDEMRHFKRLCLSLQKRMDRIGSGQEDVPSTKDSPVIRRSTDGMFNMRISRVGLDCSVEHESKLLWAQAIGQPVSGQYCVRAIFMEGRKSEAYWAPDCIHNLVAALHKLRID